ncbi:hypothetical protein N7468_001243 [Penicillium chermesinum]|uniref:C2H2-type domain-containing protein n=1 Tax=Penicillium chermesinum TaxID=63820 RepID=A0A9W9PGB8_9EURO|nr:uncharacterized protein N7468_001243 [Penicillium chermesinum]KAJ5246260.1 hypothetical protein N7468_001243 [Penicillium chermesinum]
MPLSPSSFTGEYRVSRAKKGKRVHACEWPGCEKGQVFTRAEHRRRHELSHKAKKNFMCAHESCAKSFQRAENLAQHMTRHGPNLPVQIAPSRRTKSTSSARSARKSARTHPQSSPVVPGYQSPTSETSAANPQENEKSLLSGVSDPNQPYGASNNDASLYSYPMGMEPGHSHESLFPTESWVTQLPSGFEGMIEGYMRNVLKPEAFLIPVQPAEQGPPFWNSNIDPTLSQIDSSAYQAPATPYSWTSGAESLSGAFQTAPLVPEGSPRAEHSS